MNKYKHKITEEIVLAKKFEKDTILKLNINNYFIDVFIAENNWLIFFENNNKPLILTDEEFEKTFEKIKELLFD